MLVRATATHFNQYYRVEGEEFEWEGPLHKYIVPVAPEPKRGSKRKAQPEDEE